MVKKVRAQLWQWFVITVITAFSLYMYAHIIEKVFLFDLPYVNAITVTRSPYANARIEKAEMPMSEREKYGFYGRPYTLRIPRLGLTLNLQEAQPDDNGWRVSDGSASYVVYNESEAGRLGDLVVMSADHSKILDSIHQMVEGERVALETEHWNYSFKVTRKIALTKDQHYLPTGEGTVLTIVKSTDSDVTIVIEAQFLGVQEIQK